MQIYRSLAEVPAGYRSVATVGKFDGVHCGHLDVIAQIRAEAARLGIASLVVTFDRNPLAFFRPDDCPKPLVGLEQKLELLAATGIDACLVLEFNADLAAMPADTFVTTILVDTLGVQVMFVGRDFRFGNKGAGDVARLTELGDDNGFRVEVLPDVAADQRRVSSTWIRELLDAGDIEAAAELLGRNPAVRGVVVHGAKRGRELGFPTANLSPESQGLIPADGVYAGWLRDAGQRYPAAISVGSNPTFVGVPPKQVEAYVLDQNLDLYGHEVEVEFTSRIRGMVAYSGVDPLIAQITADVRTVRELLTTG